MKRLVITFILMMTYGCATSQNLISKGEVYKGMSKTSLRNLLLNVYPNEDPFIWGGFTEYNSLKKGEIISGSSKKIYYVFENVYKPLNCNILLCKYGDGKLKSWHYSFADAKKSLTTDKNIEKQEKPIIKNIVDNDPVSSLNKLIKDFEDGKITEQEFNKKKKNILD